MVVTKYDHLARSLKDLLGILEAARKRGRVGGRPPALSPSQRAEARRIRDEEGRTMGEIAALFRVSAKTIRRA